MTPHGNLPELFLAHEREGDRFQRRLMDFVFEHRPEVIVETGSGVSSVFIAHAMATGGFGHLYSIDPSPWCGYTVEHPRVTNIRKTSGRALAQLFEQVGPFDLFLHDGNHELEGMAFDLETGFSFLAPGGWVWCDDVGWNGHDAWQTFEKRHDLIGISDCSCVRAQKAGNGWVCPKSDAAIFAASVAAACKVRADHWRASGHPDSSAFAGSPI
jgi:hypothetical protein